MPQPMSTPTAAGMIAPSVGMHRADGRALAQVRVGHQGDVRVDERHRGGALGLLAGAVLEDATPSSAALGESFHACESAGRPGVGEWIMFQIWGMSLCRLAA